MQHDAIVIGLGGMGSAALYHLARRGKRVLGIDRFGVAHARGSSHGQTRIIRKAYFEHPDYVPLLHRACTLWRELERDCGRELLVQTGLLVCGAPRGAVVRGIRSAAREHGLAIEALDLRALRRRFPAFDVPREVVGLFEADAGYLRVEECVRAHCEQAQRHGAAMRLDETVRSWSSNPDGVTVLTNRDQYQARQLVICGGPWAGELPSAPVVEGGYGGRHAPRSADGRETTILPLTVRRKVQFWLRCNQPELAVERGCPAYCFDTPTGFFYGFPMISPGEIKVAEHTGGAPITDPLTVDREWRPADFQPVSDFAAQTLRLADPQVVRHSVCMYTMTPDEHFVIDRHPSYANVCLAAGFSGHGFKFCSVVGSILADLAERGATSDPIGFLRAGRFT